MTPADKEQFRSWMRKVVDTADKLKRVMIKKNLKRARCVCPECGKFIHGRLSGPRNHLWMACETPTCMRMIE